MIKELITNSSNQFKKNIEIIINLCESEIEKIFITKIINYIVGRPDLFTIGFIFRDIDTEEIEGKLYTKEKNIYYLKSSNNYPGVLCGLKIIDIISNHCLDIYPQQIRASNNFNGELGLKEYRLDFGIYKYKLSKPDKLIKKICVECDGFEFHNSKEAIKKDNVRLRSLLLLDGYITIRYLGTEVYNLEDADIGYFLSGI